ncbi:MAG: membrane dipeptidase [Bryobacterales bacterium]|nr:membrane dipeptidase [Bryobacterales bacterium]MDE0295102.1 membrane dipeptidase [Bryobacterales bacterium]MDE0436214.1 membrane dipeptidase [Bryobacterales bacterium]
MSSQAMTRRNFLGTTAATSAALAQSATPNETIERARKVALDILKPSQRDLDHGLELHANSIVFDAYGFAPRAAIDGDAMRKAMEAGASDIELQDMREDMTMTRAAVDSAEHAEFLQAWKASGVTCIFQNCGEEGNDPLVLLKRLARFTCLTDSIQDILRRAVFPEDVRQAKQNGVGCLYFSGNGVPLTQAWVSVEDELRYVRVFYQLGIRMMHVTYNRRNRLGDGCAEPANGGLSDFGRAAVDELNRVGVIVDVAHSGWQTSLEAAQRSSKPMVASHSTCGALYEHMRSKPDNVIRAIADTGGYIGICCISRFLRHSGDITALLDHIDHVVKKFGPDHAAIGTDVAYQSRNAARERAKLPARQKGRTRWAALWPPDNFKTTGRMIQSIAWTNWPLFTVGLVQRGHSDAVIQKIIGQNVLRVLEANRVG